MRLTSSSASCHTPVRESLLAELVREYWARHDGCGAVLMDALLAEDLRTVRDEAHRLKGTAAMLGAPEVSAIAGALEDTVLEDEPDLSHAVDLAGQLHCAMAALARALLAPEPPAGRRQGL